MGIYCSRVSVRRVGSARYKHISSAPRNSEAAANYLAAASALLSRPLRRFAAFSWMIPRLAALSIAEIIARIWSGLDVCAERTVFCIVRRSVTTLRLRSDRFIVCRARLAADLVLAIVLKNCGRARSRARRHCQPSRFAETRGHPPTH